jgi:hypothetical protein
LVELLVYSFWQSAHLDVLRFCSVIRRGVSGRV